MSAVNGARPDESHGGAPAPAPCEGVAARTGPPASGGMGTLRIALTQVAASGARYRLEGALFSSVLYLALEPGADVSVRFRFEVQVPGAALAAADIARTLGVLERPDAPSGRVCVESPIDPEGYVVFRPWELAALEGCREVRGELYLGLESSADLGPLSELERVCGALSISSTASLGLELLDDQSLAGLEALEEVDALFISHPGVRSLAPLGSLRRIQRRDVENDVLGLFATSSSLEDMRGLEQLTEIQSVHVDGGESLRSLA
jgi:hypothetical protein